MKTAGTVRLRASVTVATSSSSRLSRSPVWRASRPDQRLSIRWMNRRRCNSLRRLISVRAARRALAAESSSWAVRLHASHPVYVDRPSSEGPVAISIRCLHTYTKNRETPTCSTPVDMQPTTDSRNPSDACHSHLAHSRIRIDALMDCLSFLQSVVSSAVGI